MLFTQNTVNQLHYISIKKKKSAYTLWLKIKMETRICSGFLKAAKLLNRYELTRFKNGIKYEIKLYLFHLPNSQNTAVATIIKTPRITKYT